MQIRKGNRSELGKELLTDISHYRYKVFVENLGWPLNCPDQLETDQFDREDTLYVAAQNDAGEIVGTARLLPTTRPYLLSQVFPDLLGGQSAPSLQHVWELSRFAAMDLRSQHLTKRQQAPSSSTALLLLLAAIKYAKSHGAMKLLTVSPVGIIRLLHREKFKVRRLGPSKISEDLKILALEIDI
ncbi:hypothetical protein BK659_20285 [Pseudomonas brassicacearum]|uniref:Acyl-homoserine-lactone synthase n=1 Tax=Pseudomonas brassicacearum TaxID=930166 RepID=A0A423H339_9PSED|nr:acyl-homoserine-lactone synthase [Pseudomonas brassicacearum]RON06634.1 hypothetical protein BK659_20285 [Pseudomonas brassicacearum]